VPSGYFNKHGQIMMTNPGILTTESLAEYVGEELLGSDIGKGLDVGVRTSARKDTDRRNRLVPLTDGSLINLLETGNLYGISMFIIDEAHLRTLNIDTILKLLRHQLPIYPHIKVIVASATIDADRFVMHFGSTATKVELEGKSFIGLAPGEEPYTKEFRDPQNALPYDNMAELRGIVVSALVEKVIELIPEALSDKDSNRRGDILGFLHGIEPIKEAVKSLRVKISRNPDWADIIDVYPLYSGVEKKIESKAKAPSLKGRLKIVISTNVAEASLTVDGIVHVVESGIENQAQWDQSLSMLKVPTVMISQANAKQRWGRSGRTRKGFVHCLYTEEQFGQMPGYPVPAMQRSNIDQVVLNSIAAGAAHIGDDWLEAPLSDSLDGSVKKLVASGAITEEGHLTEYGTLLKHMSYPAEISSMLMLADQLGCLTEIATLLPIIKNGGLRKVLRRNKNWDAETKYQVGTLHRALMQGCADDIEFLLKIFSAWNEQPWTDLVEAELNHTDDSRLTKADRFAIRSAGADSWFVNHNLLGKLGRGNQIAEGTVLYERDEIIEMFSGKRKDDSIRPINFNNLDRVRMVLLVCFPYLRSTLIGENEQYLYNPFVDYQEGTSVSVRCKVHGELLNALNHSPIGTQVSPEWMMQLIDWWENATHDSNDLVFTRLFIEQLYEPGTRFEAHVADKNAPLGSMKFVRNRIPVGEVMRLDEEEDEDDGEHDQAELKSLRLNRRFSQFKFERHLVGEPSSGKLIVEVSGYNFSRDRVIVDFSEIPQPEPYDDFVLRYTQGATIQVQIDGVDEYPGEYSVSLVAHELVTGLRILLESDQIMFASSYNALRSVPIDSIFEVEVDEILYEYRRVKLSRLSMLEEFLAKQIEDGSQRKGTMQANGTIVDVRKDGKLTFLLDLSIPAQGYLVTCQAFGKVLVKAVEMYEVGQRFVVVLRRDPHFTTRVKANLSEQTLERLTKYTDEDFFVDGTMLCFKGAMKTARRGELEAAMKKGDKENKEYKRAIERLYWKSNTLFVTRLYDSVAEARVTQSYPPGLVLYNRPVVEIDGGRYLIEVEHGLEAFVPRGKIFRHHRELVVGTLVTAQVVEFDEMRHQLILTLMIPDNDVPSLLREGFVYEGIVKGSEQYGVFVELLPTVQGLLHKSEVPEFFVGKFWLELKVAVRIKKVEWNEQKRKWNVSLALP
jgi:Helicase conserved C-terminal domain/Helicase associated domain (HA2)/S1 RNA binding domain